jgi:hypothetical protein
VDIERVSQRELLDPTGQLPFGVELNRLFEAERDVVCVALKAQRRLASDRDRLAQQRLERDDELLPSMASARPRKDAPRRLL